MTVEIISRSISKEVWDRAGIKLVTLDLQSDSLPTAILVPVNILVIFTYLFTVMISEFP